MFRYIKWFIQRRVRGFDDREVWELDSAFAKWIVPRLKEYRKIHIGHPFNFTDKAYNQMLDEMIEGFEIMSEGCMPWDEKNPKVINAIELFCTNCRSLWD